MSWPNRNKVLGTVTDPENKKIGTHALARPAREIVSEALERQWQLSGESYLGGWQRGVAHAVGCHENTIDNLQRARNAPETDQLLALFAYFGAEFTNQILEPTGLLAVKRDRSIGLAGKAELVEDIRAMLKKHTGKAA